MHKRPFLSFSLLFIAVLFITISTIYFLIMQFKVSPAPENLSAFGGVLEGTLGIAVGLSGALFAIIIAYLSYRITDMQKKREDYLELSRTIDSHTQPIINLLKNYRSLYWSYTQFEAELTQYKKNNTSTSDFQYIRKKIASNLGNVADSLLGITENHDALSLWLSKTADENLMLDKLSTEALQQKLSIKDDPVEVAKMLQKFAENIDQTADSVNLGHLKGCLNYAQNTKDIEGNNLNNAAIKTLLFAGADLRIQPCAGKHLVNLGGAILHDLLIAIPEKEGEINDYLKNNIHFKISNKDVVDDMPFYKLLEEKGLKFWFGSSLKEVNDELEKNQLDFKSKI